MWGPSEGHTAEVILPLILEIELAQKCQFTVHLFSLRNPTSITETWLFAPVRHFSVTTYAQPKLYCPVLK